MTRSFLIIAAAAISVLQASSADAHHNCPGASVGSVQVVVPTHSCMLHPRRPSSETWGADVVIRDHSTGKTTYVRDHSSESEGRSTRQPSQTRDQRSSTEVRDHRERIETRDHRESAARERAEATTIRDHRISRRDHRSR
jgi:hypothetical protein